jgi:hypothetical protein
LYQNDAEVLFPARAVQALASLRGPKWQALVAHVSRLQENDPDVLAFSLLMIRLDGCLTCHADSFRAMRGCTACARQSVSRFKGSDEDLIAQWELARDEIVRWLKTGEAPAMC